METQGYMELKAQFKKLKQAGLCSGGTVAWTYNKYGSRVSFGKEYDRAVYYDLASLTKMFVNIMALMLIDQGVISLDLKVSQILGLKDGKHTEKLTFHHLLTYTVYFELGDYKVNGADTSYRDFIDRLKTADLKAEPGTQFHYTNLAPILVGMVLEQVTGKNMDQLVHEYLCNERYCFTFNPPIDQCVENFCIETNGWVQGIAHDHTARKAWNECGVRAMCAGLFATIDDIMNFSNDLIAGKVVSQEMLDLMRVNQLGHILRSDGTPLEFGLGVDLSGQTIVANTYIGHQLRIDVESGAVSLLMKNVTFSDAGYEPLHRKDNMLTRRLTREFLSGLFEQERKVI